MSRLASLTAMLFLCAVPAYAQTGTAPVLTRQPYAPYPEPARKAHVSGEAMVSFSIDPAGKPIKVNAVSGPELLTSALQEEIRSWRFVTPLPRDSEKDFVADYTYTIIEPAKPVASESKPKPKADADTDPADEEEDEPAQIAAVAGVVRSANNRQNIDATPLIKSEKYSAPGATTLPN